MKNTMPYYIYILECANGSLYTGITIDLERRFKEHKAGKGAHYTRANPPIKMVYSEVCGSRSEALKHEAKIKGLSRKQKLALIKTSNS